MVLIAFIIPIYFGNKYIPGLLEMFNENKKKLNSDFFLEVIFINDSPQEVISELPENNSIKITVINNNKNQGIHFSRIRGLLSTTADYVVFLDQDDRITPDFLCTQLSNIKSADIIVGNGIAELDKSQKCLYRYKVMQNSVKWKWCHAVFGCRIISPGHCLIRRNAIPREWTENIIINNGADDFFLWLLMLNKKKKFVINRKNIYVHRYTEENTSLDIAKMNESLKEVSTALTKINGVDIKTLRRINNQISRNSSQYVSVYKKILQYIIYVGEKINRNNM